MKDKIIKYIKEDLIDQDQEFELAVDEDLLSGGLIDSMGIVRLITFIEDEFQTSIPPEDMTIENFMTVEAIVNYLQRQQA